MSAKKFNWPIWAGLLLSIIAFITYPLVFVWFPVTRDFPWANLPLFVLAAALLIVGLRRSFATDRARPLRSRIVGSTVAVLSVLVFGLFIFIAFIMPRQLPASQGAPQVGQKAPDFTLGDINGKPVSLTELVTTPVAGKPVRGVLLVFYRGYW
jgi:hypothetical protein